MGKAKRNTVIAIVCTVLVVALLGSLVAYSSLVTSGYFLRNTVVATTENYEVDNAVFSYFFHKYYQEFNNTYGYYFPIDTGVSLKGQTCTLYSDGSTWFDFFAANAKSTLSNTLAFCEEANARGITLTEEDHKEIDEAIASIKTAAKQAGVTTSYYTHVMFGSGVNQKDVRRALELSVLASKCNQAIVDSYNYTEADFNKYIEENPDALVYAEYAAFDMNTSDTLEDDVKTAEMLQSYLDRFAQVTTKEEFEAVAFDYLRNVTYLDDEKVTDDAIREEVSALSTKSTYVKDDATAEWAFADDRKAGDVFTEISEDKTTYSAYMLLATPSLDEYNTVNIRHILLSSATYGSDEAAKAKAEELLAGFTGGADAFAALANEYSEDTGSNTNGGLYENVGKGEMVESFDAWIYADGRKAGDTGIVKSDYGYHVMFFVGEGEIAWHVQANNALKNAQYSKDSAEINAKYVTTFDDRAIFELDV
jgi:parvulin-like peptidyl-prolyl isomerase